MYVYVCESGSWRRDGRNDTAEFKLLQGKKILLGLGDATNLQHLQEETTIDLEAIQNEEVQFFMDNFNIHSLYH